jgi:hypothetical protein
MKNYKKELIYKIIEIYLISNDDEETEHIKFSSIKDLISLSNEDLTLILNSHKLPLSEVDKKVVDKVENLNRTEEILLSIKKANDSGAYELSEHLENL